MANPADYKSNDEKTFSELLAESAQETKESLVLSTLQAFKDGEPGAIKLVMQALTDSQFKEETNFPLTDERFKQIITMAADAISKGLV